LIEITVHQSSIYGICNSVGVYSHLEIIRQLTQFILDILRWTCNSYIHVKGSFYRYQNNQCILRSVINQ